jgi:hypothetical protein
MGKILVPLIFYMLGVLTAVSWFGVDRMLVSQQAFDDGKARALSRPVTLKGPEPCNISIPLSALVDLVNTGILDWHEACVAATGGKDE